MKRIYVGNLPYQVLEQDLETAFAQYGAIESVMLIKDRETGRAKGFGFIEFENEEGANKALEMDGKDFQGRPLKVSLAQERSPDAPQRSGGGGGSRRY